MNLVVRPAPAPAPVHPVPSSPPVILQSRAPSLPPSKPSSPSSSSSLSPSPSTQSFSATLQRMKDERAEILQHALKCKWPSLTWLRKACREDSLRTRLEHPRCRQMISEIIANYTQSRYYVSFHARHQVGSARGQVSAHVVAWNQMDNVPSGYYSHGML